ncbi:FA8A1-like protein [Mya arenaria]|uniref:FA8A1-like protein n=1 Tax=Mya arenaria TaxID=6604 RepID=A0ABY7FWS5_MYAAR|nr:FA8A1-like protein [Mya arenaria]
MAAVNKNNITNRNPKIPDNIDNIEREKSTSAKIDSDHINSCDSSYFFNSDVHADSRNCQNLREYAQAVQTWLWHYRTLQAFGMFQAQVTSSMQQNIFLQQQRVGTSQNTQSAWQPPNGQTNPVPPAVQYKVPMLWRRMVAELLDFILLFYTKIIVSVAVLRQMGYMNEDILDIDVQLPYLADITELDYDKMFTLTSELIALEIINRLCITIVETLCIRQGYAGSVGGATPGKKIMHLKIISFDDIHEIGNRNIVVTGPKDIGFVNALLRSVIKNFSMAFFFPASFTVFFFRYNRAAYDVLAQTIVVESDRRH